MDFNPFSPATDSLLYTWEELRECSISHTDAQNVSMQTPFLTVGSFFTVSDDSEAEIRIVETQTANNAPRFATNMVPKEVVDLSDGRTIAEFAEEFQRAMALAGQSDSDGDEEDE